ncbi:MAG: hypothetical protein ABEK01_02150 [Candidatus Nanohaloarchaea archaeon]
MEARTLAILAVVVVATGCIHQNTDTNNPPINDNPEPSGKGLEITQFSITDSTLRPGQRAEVTVGLKNYHTKEISLNEIKLYNLGKITAEKRGCTPGQLQKATASTNPVMICNWRITAPSEDYIENFESKDLTFTLRLSYDSNVRNSNPLKITFKPISDINRTSSVTKSFNNGEVRVKMETENPIGFPREGDFEGKTIEFTVRNAGDGNVVGDYSFSYSPESLFHDCPDSDTPVIEDKVDFQCKLKSDVEATRNLFFSARYKYVKERNKNVELVKP